jgi:hypothetical protein
VSVPPKLLLISLEYPALYLSRPELFKTTKVSYNVHRKSEFDVPHPRNILRHLNSLLSNDRETNKQTTVVIRQRPVNSNRGMALFARSATMAAHATAG